jgi:hypothetical protein
MSKKEKKEKKKARSFLGGLEGEIKSIKDIFRQLHYH